MAVPNYTYLKLKMPGPHGVITIGTSFQRAYECQVECCSHATTIVTFITYPSLDRLYPLLRTFFGTNNTSSRLDVGTFGPNQYKPCVHLYTIRA